MSASLSPSSLRDQLTELARRHREQLPPKLREMRDIWRILKQGWQTSAAESLHRMAHGMAGAGGTMGLPEVGAAARALEQRLKSLLEAPAQWPAFAAPIESALERLEAAIGRVEGAGEMPAASQPGPQEFQSLPPLRILVADDEPLGREVLSTLLRADGHAVFAAEDGEQAVALFEREAPDMVLMDVVMPGMNGYEAAAVIKSRCGQRFVPLIFLTALQEERHLARCIAAGGDDFMVKPYNGLLLKAKLIAMNRIRLLHQELSLYRLKTAEEIELSKRVFDAITGRNPDLPQVRSWLSSVGHFCGDVLLYRQTAEGRLVLMLGDFTGHGLAAAIGALPVADVFYPMVAQGRPLERIVSEINSRLHDVLPVGHFCSAVFLDIDPREGRIRYWNGGSPDGWLVGAGGVLAAIASDRLPLGIVGSAAFDSTVGDLPGAGVCSVVLHSDGLSEARNPEGAMLGVEGVRELVNEAAAGDLLGHLRQACVRFQAGRVPDDDLSLVVVDLGAA